MAKSFNRNDVVLKKLIIRDYESWAESKYPILLPNLGKHVDNNTDCAK